MIYIGYYGKNSSSDLRDKLIAALKIETPHQFIQLPQLMLVCSKESNLHDKDEVWVNDTEIIIGRFFSKPPNTISKEQFKQFNTSSLFLDKIWGKFVYFSNSYPFKVVVDSTGQMPYYFYTFSNGDILFSSTIQLLYQFLSRSVEYNWDYICAYLTYGQSCVTQTPFKGVKQLPPGCYLKVHDNQQEVDCFWDPVSSSSPIMEPEDATHVLLSMLKQAIEPYSQIFVNLSGGLDSSVLAYCLNSVKHDKQSIKAINYYHADICSSNELIHAAKVCEETNIPLIAVDTSACLPFDITTNATQFLPNIPSPGLVHLREKEFVATALNLQESSLFISGQGGDHIYMCPPSKLALSDYLIEKGFSGANQILTTLASYYRESFFSLIKNNLAGLSKYILGRKTLKWNKNWHNELPMWFNSSLRNTKNHNYEHPIYSFLSKRVLPAKYQQVDAIFDGIASIQPSYSPFYPLDNIFFPYLSSPMVEHALSYPTYNLFSQIYDRYPLRKSAGDRFGTKTVWRRDKGDITGVFQLGVKKNLDNILMLCLEGQIAQQQLIDKNKLAHSILQISQGDTNDLWPFTFLASMEIFLNHWQTMNNSLMKIRH